MLAAAVVELTQDILAAQVAQVAGVTVALKLEVVLLEQQIEVLAVVVVAGLVLVQVVMVVTAVQVSLLLATQALNVVRVVQLLHRVEIQSIHSQHLALTRLKDKICH
jgi:hypothetical protein